MIITNNASKERSKIFIVLEENQLRILHIILFFNSEGEIKTVSEKQNKKFHH